MLAISAIAGVYLVATFTSTGLAKLCQRTPVDAARPRERMAEHRKSSRPTPRTLRGQLHVGVAPRP
jgi:hypothetical protein